MKALLNSKKAPLLAVCLTCLLAIGCSESESKKTGTAEAGTVLSAKEVATSWNDMQRTRIETTKGIFVVRGIISTFKGKEARVDTYDDGNSYLCIDGKNTCPPILGG